MSKSQQNSYKRKPSKRQRKVKIVIYINDYCNDSFHGDSWNLLRLFNMYTTSHEL